MIHRAHKLARAALFALALDVIGSANIVARRPLLDAVLREEFLLARLVLVPLLTLLLLGRLLRMLLRLLRRRLLSLRLHPGAVGPAAHSVGSICSCGAGAGGDALDWARDA